MYKKSSLTMLSASLISSLRLSLSSSTWIFSIS